MPKTVKLFISVLLFFFILVSCDKDEIINHNDSITTFKAELKGLSEVPPNTSSVNGVTILTYNNISREFNAITSYNGFTPTSGHIHIAVNDGNGPASIPLVNNFALSVLKNKNALEVEQDGFSIAETKTNRNLIIENFKSPFGTQSVQLTDEQVKALFEGKMYVDFHTNDYPNGEIKGQLLKQ